MAKINHVNNIDSQKVMVEAELNEKELRKLKGIYEDIHIFSENNLISKTRLIQRGKNEPTKYFLLPRTLRDGIAISKTVKYNKIETENNYIYIFMLSKEE